MPHVIATLNASELNGNKITVRLPTSAYKEAYPNLDIKQNGINGGAQNSYDGIRSNFSYKQLDASNVPVFFTYFDPENFHFHAVFQDQFEQLSNIQADVLAQAQEYIKYCEELTASVIFGHRSIYT